MVFLGFLLYVSYNKGAEFAEKAPQYATRVRMRFRHVQKLKEFRRAQEA